jgi:hypothetical protein
VRARLATVAWRCGSPPAILHPPAGASPTTCLSLCSHAHPAPHSGPAPFTGGAIPTYTAETLTLQHLSALELKQVRCWLERPKWAEGLHDAGHSRMRKPPGPPRAALPSPGHPPAGSLCLCLDTHAQALAPVVAGRQWFRGCCCHSENPDSPPRASSAPHRPRRHRAHWCHSRGAAGAAEPHDSPGACVGRATRIQQ